LSDDQVSAIVEAFPRLEMKRRFMRAICRIAETRPETTYDNFAGDFGERFVPGYQRQSTVDYLLNSPFTNESALFKSTSTPETLLTGGLGRVAAVLVCASPGSGEHEPSLVPSNPLLRRRVWSLAATQSVANGLPSVVACLCRPATRSVDRRSTRQRAVHSAGRRATA
jgi:hypothetical protein